MLAGHPAPKAAPPKDRAICSAWNGGGCSPVGPCPNGEKHACFKCGGGHRARDCRGKGGGKNRNGGKGSSKGSKGKSTK